jgi:hypothetical protein
VTEDEDDTIREFPFNCKLFLDDEKLAIDDRLVCSSDDSFPLNTDSVLIRSRIRFKRLARPFFESFSGLGGWGL